jgi:predicted nucleic acid-binding protein
MLAVSNTSPISNLAWIGRVEPLRSQFDEIWIPDAVKQGLHAHPGDQALAAIHSALDTGWLRVSEVPSTALYKILSLQIHRGEAAAIALAAELRADWVIIDEQEARGLATQAGVPVVGTLGILLN